MTLKPKEAASLFIKEYFPDCDVAILAGSVVRGGATNKSDLDIIVIKEDEREYRASYKAFGWPVEVFFHNWDSPEFVMEMERRAGIPLFIRMCSDGVFLRENTRGAALKKDAMERLKKGPMPWSKDEIDQERYLLTDLVEDLEGSENDSENLFTVCTLSRKIPEFMLRTKQKWMGEGKWIFRSLKEADEQAALRLEQSLTAFFEQKDKKKLIELVDNELKPFGGRLFNGFSNSVFF
ncbi:nucleotidyltransferase domain-containing protein [Pseudalkalibacillus caeni]|uniref:Nucleotidyltransferase domain-containing protein n=1 Tax=Exobacillus caeni TaxID=2574798 RepID=A0A5R9F2W3_9BACL|nr:nucleotidyltransferase domain-containing protein [Pseudalkalibacillus caeni]TLS37927.1 nucleotidyltransferase domain-containing protein [Pseudalkalibacillus caeni]